MAYDGNGVFLPLASPTFPAFPGQVIYSDYFNANLKNIHDGLTAALPRDGQAAMAGNLQMAGYKITGLGAAAAAGQALEYQQWLDSFYSPAFTIPTTETPVLSADNKVIPNTAWVRLVLNSAAALNLPPVAGKSGQLTTDGTNVYWANGIPDYFLTSIGVI